MIRGGPGAWEADLITCRVASRHLIRHWTAAQSGERSSTRTPWRYAGYPPHGCWPGTPISGFGCRDVRWRDGLGLVPEASIVPHYDAWPEPICALIALQAPRGSVVLGIDEGTAVVGRDGSWQVHGRSRVTLWRGRRRDRYRAGEVFRLDGRED
jgi:hypothetical protein